MARRRSRRERCCAPESASGWTSASPAEEDYALLRKTFDFHELALEDSEQFEQRPKLEDYDGFVFLVVYGWSPDEDGLVEVHCFFAERYLVTVRRDASPTIDALARQARARTPSRSPPGRCSCTR